MNLLPWPDLKERHRQPEVMDQPGLEAEVHHRALRGLGRINRLSRSTRILWPSIRRAAKQSPRAPLKVLDLACGGGDVTIGLWQAAQSAGLRIAVSGCDLSPVAVEYARRSASEQRADVDFFQRDVIGAELPIGYDVLCCSLFLHHLCEDDAGNLLARSREAAGRLVLINDLVRSRTGYCLAYFGTRLLSRSPVVHVDGPLSVHGAFTLDEVRSMAERANMADARVQKCWPERFLLSWTKT